MMADLHLSIVQLITALKAVRKQWDDTKILWNDSISLSFERQNWTPLENNAQSTLKEIQNLNQVIAEAHWRVK
jgi:hypothetical protein